MLQTLHIENYALIRETDIAFGQGFTAITGETGAGKSIILGALGLLLGQRASVATLADHEHKCVVEAHFDISELHLESLFDEADIDYDNLLILRREVLPSGKSRAFANDTPVQLAFLQQLGPHIIDIHSQHQTLTLADRNFRLSLLDSLVAHSALPDYQRTYRKYTSLKHDLETLVATETESRREQDYLQFQFDELTAARLTEDEQQQLEQESQLLSHAEAIKEGLTSAAIAIDDESDSSVLSRLRTAKNALSHISSYHPDAEALCNRIDSVLIEADDIATELQHTANRINYSSERQQEVDDRLSLLYRLQKKHSVNTVSELIALREEFKSKLQTISTLDDRIHDLMEQVDQAYAALQQAADLLTQQRIAAGKALSEAILPTLHELGMPDARFAVQVDPSSNYTPQGHDTVQLLFNANRGMEMHDVSQVASGGELSRLMLAIKSMLTSHSLLPTIIFDEIDTGVSGDIAGAVGRIMCRMAEHMQVVAITHLPQIAARAEQHLKVYKHVEGESTVSLIRELTPSERIVELASMLSSGSPSEAAMQTARELMQ